MHVFPQLRKLEEKFAREVTVVGVHSAKFTAEKETENLRRAVLRYEIDHPVVNDRDFQVWREYTVRAWPTLMFIDPVGKLIGKHEGEIALDAFEKLISDMIKEYDAQGLIQRSELKFKLEKEKEWERALSFPGKILADSKSGRLYVADSNHNRIVVTDLNGKALDIIGSGQQGYIDGSFQTSAFYDPQGMALAGDQLYVADTKNHAIRKVDLVTQEVTTIAGTGEQAKVFHEGGPGTLAAINSPWDIEIIGDKIYIAMAGFHQLWVLDLKLNEIRPFAGSGRERIEDGPLLNAALAQPSGIVANGMKLYFTDSETSAVRSAELNSGGSVVSIVGQDLFTFGDRDGTGDEVRLQHPLGIDLDAGSLYITDTYNNKIKRINPDTRRATSLLGSGKPGHVDGPADTAEFHEPGGISVDSGNIYIADTNNHVIRVAALDTLEVSTLQITGLD
jgi:DNA-binding beta-propeller fold protein YncE